MLVARCSLQTIHLKSTFDHPPCPQPIFSTDWWNNERNDRERERKQRRKNAQHTDQNQFYVWWLPAAKRWSSERSDWQRCWLKDLSNCQGHLFSVCVHCVFSAMFCMWLFNDGSQYFFFSSSSSSILYFFSRSPDVSFRPNALFAQL